MATTGTFEGHPRVSRLARDGIGGVRSGGCGGGCGGRVAGGCEHGARSGAAWLESPRFCSCSVAGRRCGVKCCCVCVFFVWQWRMIASVYRVNFFVMLWKAFDPPSLRVHVLFTMILHGKNRRNDYRNRTGLVFCLSLSYRT